jgi:hypothetical protein
MKLKSGLNSENLIKLIQEHASEFDKKKKKIKEEYIEGEVPLYKGFTTIPFLLEKYSFLKPGIVYKAVKERSFNGLEDVVVKVGKKCFVNEFAFLKWCGARKSGKKDFL